MQASLIQLKASMNRMVDIGDMAWEDLLGKLVYKELAKKEKFVKEGSICKAVAFVVKGATRYYYTIEGEEVTTFFTFENSWISSYKSFIEQKPSMVTVEAMEDSALWILSYTDLQALYRKYHAIERFGRMIGEFLYCCMDDRSYGLLLKSPEQRYLHSLQENSQYFERVPQRYIASYLGIAPESLSRIRKRVMQKSIS
jgi:CRP-like cAMP-binding protein